ncbi:MAG TPA: Hsp20/alpha crystallin family protein [Polyangiaceae bacterium]|nr:Hsp20/alpha crystallin family protein [Polyangiaceae bacterium]
MSQISSYRNGDAPRGVAPRSQPHAKVSPAVDVFENAEEVRIVADVPGVAAGAIDIRVENGTLTIEAKRVEPADGVPRALAREYDEADFVRSFRIPAGIDTANVVGEAKNGTLVVKLPKAAEAKPRKIAVRSS